MGLPVEYERWSDEALLRAISGGCDRDAFAAFYRRHLSLVVGFLARETRDLEAAADLAAEVFAAVALAARRYRSSYPSAAPWLIGIARRKVSVSRRRGRVEVRARQGLGCEPIALLDSDLERVQAIVDDERGQLRGLVDSLPGDERDAIKRRVVEEQDYAEIAAELRCSELVVRKRVSRGLARLREQLKES